MEPGQRPEKTGCWMGVGGPHGQRRDGSHGGRSLGMVVQQRELGTAVMGRSRKVEAQNCHLSLLL